MEILLTLQMSAKTAEPVPQLASPKPAKQSPMAALKGFLRSPPRADKAAEAVVVIHRTVEGRDETINAQMNTQVMPGDVLDVSVSLDAAG